MWSWESKSADHPKLTNALRFIFRHILSLCSQVEYDGLTGRVEFNSKGQRTNYTLHILEKHKSGHKQVTHIHTSSPHTVLILGNGLYEVFLSVYVLDWHMVF